MFQLLQVLSLSLSFIKNGCYNDFKTAHIFFVSFLTTDILFALHVSVEDAHFVAIDKLIETITQESLTFFLQSSIFSSLVPDEFTVGVKHITYATAFVY